MTGKRTILAITGALLVLLLSCPACQNSLFTKNNPSQDPLLVSQKAPGSPLAAPTQDNGAKQP